MAARPALRSWRCDDPAVCGCGKDFGSNQNNYDVHCEAARVRKSRRGVSAEAMSDFAEAEEPVREDHEAPVSVEPTDLLELTAVLAMHLHTRESLEFATIKRVLSATHGYIASLLGEVLEVGVASEVGLALENLEARSQALRGIQDFQKLLNLEPLPVVPRVVGESGEEGKCPQVYEVDISRDLRSMLEADDAKARQFVESNARWKEAAQTGERLPDVISDIDKGQNWRRCGLVDAATFAHRSNRLVHGRL